MLVGLAHAIPHCSCTPYLNEMIPAPCFSLYQSLRDSLQSAPALFSLEAVALKLTGSSEQILCSADPLYVELHHVLNKDCPTLCLEISLTSSGYSVTSLSAACYGLFSSCNSSSLLRIKVL